MVGKLGSGGTTPMETNLQAMSYSMMLEEAVGVGAEEDQSSCSWSWSSSYCCRLLQVSNCLNQSSRDK